MALSSSTDFTLTGTEIVTEARRRLGIQPTEEALTAAELTEGLTALNLMLKTWAADGVMYWTMTEGSLSLVQGTQSYSFASGGDFTTVPFDMMDVRITRDSTDLPMTELSREEYFALPNKTVQGYPTQWFYDRQRDTGTLYVWPTADASLGTLKFTYRRTLMDMDEGTNNIDLPQEWLEAIVYNLADRLSDTYGIPVPSVSQKALAFYQVVRAFNVGEGTGSVMIEAA